MLARVIICLLFFSSVAFAESTQLLDKVVALVNDDVITETELNAQVDVLKRQILAKKMALPEDKTLRKQVLQHLIDVDLQLQLAKNNGITVDSIELDEAINKIAETNKLTLSQLREEVIRQGMSWKEYRQNIRKEMIISRLQQKAVGKDVVVSKEQVENYLKAAKQTNKSEQTFHVQNIVIPLPEEPTTEQLTKAKNKAQKLLAKIKKGENFSRLAVEESSGEFALEGGDLGERHLAELPDVFAKEVVKMKAGEVAGPLRTGNGYQLIKLISTSENKKQPHLITKTHVRHILLKPTAGMTPEEARKQVNNIYQQLKAGKDFALMAKQYSLDATSAVKGGDLGWVKPGELVPEFEDTMNKLPLNKVSEPVKSQFGWHLIQVLGRKKEDDSDAFEKAQVLQHLQQRKFVEAVQNWQQHLRADAYVKIMDKDLT
ncbi:molecular chaperone SurA [Legionella israelensis]|uniref:Chaperone SurA n=1 Tax=Legionella israelensis TaxID=454 RepID=A0AAX1EJC3_9GAMM|nr:peptidylprolyl isomerase [Legionella israelensis]QBR85203.1 molecular chaperone SurA [Legionella israelensis]